MNNPQLQRAFDYIKNTVESPTFDQFDEDHEPIGPKLREQLKDEKLVYESDGRIYQCPANAER